MSEMVITCPECGTSYRTDSGSIGSNGRTVRCAKCKETWFVPSPGIGSADARALDEDLLPEADTVERITPPAPVGPATSVPAAAPSADVLLRDAADAQRLAARKRTIRIIWITAALLALAAIVVAVLNRQEIVNRQPKAATLYNAVGFTVRAGGLEIDPPTARTSLVDGRPVIRVDGAVRNLSRDTKTVPLIELTLHDRSGEALVQWFVEPEQAQLAGRARLPFSTEYADPPTDATGLRYRFAQG